MKFKLSLVECLVNDGAIYIVRATLRKLNLNLGGATNLCDDTDSQKRRRRATTAVIFRGEGRGGGFPHGGRREYRGEFLAALWPRIYDIISTAVIADDV